MKKVILILCGLFCAIITFAQASGGQIVRKKTTKVGVKTKAEKQLYNKHSTIPISKEQQQILDIDLHLIIREELRFCRRCRCRS